MTYDPTLAPQTPRTFIGHADGTLEVIDTDTYPPYEPPGWMTVLACTIIMLFGCGMLGVMYAWARAILYG